MIASVRWAMFTQALTQAINGIVEVKDELETQLKTISSGSHEVCMNLKSLVDNRTGLAVESLNYLGQVKSASELKVILAEVTASFNLKTHDIGNNNSLSINADDLIREQHNAVESIQQHWREWFQRIAKIYPNWITLICPRWALLKFVLPTLLIGAVLLFGVYLFSACSESHCPV